MSAGVGLCSAGHAGSWVPKCDLDFLGKAFVWWHWQGRVRSVVPAHMTLVVQHSCSWAVFGVMWRNLTLVFFLAW